MLQNKDIENAGRCNPQLDEEANKAVEEVKKLGFTPWHVVKTEDGGVGTMYTVLYVSGETADWKYERMDKHGTLQAYVRNATYPECSEIGSVTLACANGGFMRIE